ncbi:hypothetical protein CSKR_108851 [Clonorchis sinensis]|uniref:Uncharacterized protein n=1 Tax=Clonorchis sinensis TaxID=79923 RepID=A0A3R7FCG9_CLOSI|nr:hypothetical protein CSKR_108851 [Clonorchis sinensis]
MFQLVRYSRYRSIFSYTKRLTRLLKSRTNENQPTTAETSSVQITSRDSTASLVNDILRLNALHKGHLMFQLNGDRVIPTAPGWRRRKIWLPTDVSGDLVVGFYPDCLNQCLELDSAESLVCDILQLNVLHTGHLMFHLVRCSRDRSVFS